MQVNILKSGTWALKGVTPVNVKEGSQDVHNDLALELIEAGWAEAESIKKIVDEITAEKKTAGWWHVKFPGRDKIVRVRGADDKAEAIILANAELEVE